MNRAYSLKDRDANAKGTGYRFYFLTGTLLRVPFLRSGFFQKKGTLMRTLVEPPPWSRCDLCGAEMRLKLVEPADRNFDMEKEIFVCASCGRERSYTVMHDPYTPHIKAAH